MVNDFLTTCSHWCTYLMSLEILSSRSRDSILANRNSLTAREAEADGRSTEVICDVSTNK